MLESLPIYSSQQIVERRPQRNKLDPRRPYSLFVEKEQNSAGEIIDVATLFLTNRECPFRCLMCDLWKHTLTDSVAPGDIPEQIRWGLEQLPSAREIKLYNSGNFFDTKAILPEDYSQIADLVRHFETVIVENHPNLCNQSCVRFRDMIAPAKLEIAMGLETCHSEVLKSLNKLMTLSDFEDAAKFLHQADIRTRAFLLLKPPFMEESEAIEWTLKSLNYAFDNHVNCCAVIPTRAGNGIMDDLAAREEFFPPRGTSLEYVLEQGLQLKRGRVFVDLWDVDRFFPCAACSQQRLDRLQSMNLQQTVLSPISCPGCTA